MIWMFKLAWKNLWRNKTRTLITISAIMFALILAVLASSLKEGIFANLVKNMVSFYSGYVQVHQKGYWKEQILDNSFENKYSLQHAILTNNNISAVAPRIESFALASSAEVTKGCMVVGTNPEEENKVTFLNRKLIRGSYFNLNDKAVLLASGLAEQLKVGINDTIVLIGQGYHGSTAAGKFPVKGILQFGSPDLNDRILYLPLRAAQEFYAADGMITSMIIQLKDADAMLQTQEALQQTLSKNYEVMNWGELMPDIKQHIETDTNNMKYVQGILYVLISFGIFGTLLMMMVERKREMGMMVAIGMKKTFLMLVLVIESVLTVLTGCLLGLMISIPVVYYFKKFPIRIGGETAKAYERFGFEAIFPTSVETGIFIDQGIVVLVIGLLLSLYPVYKIIRLNAINALKR
jgi:ABC-type lipoprotein release transport system permease subunit